MEIKALIENINSSTDTWSYSTKDDVFSSNQVISAYEIGRNEGLDLGQKLILNKFEENLDRSAKDTKVIVEYFRSKGFNPISSHLKIESIYSFSLLVVIPADKSEDDSILELYRFITLRELETSEEFYHLFVMICDSDEPIGENQLKVDGFTLRHIEFSK